MLLLELRKRRGMSQRALAEAVGMKTSTISMYELGLRIPTLATAKKIADYFGLSVDVLFFDPTPGDTTNRGGTPCA